MNEADNCRNFVVPKLQSADWDDRPNAINAQRAFTDGRNVFADGKARHGRMKRTDDLLRYSPDIPIAVVQAEARYKQPAKGFSRR